MDNDSKIALYGKILQAIPDWMDGLEVRLVLQSGTYPIENIVPIEDTNLFRAKELGKDAYYVFPFEKLELTIVKADSDFS